MIRVVRKPMTDEVRARYEARVLDPGRRWLEANPPVPAKAGEPAPKQKRLPALWREVCEELADAFHDRCAYSAMWLSHPRLDELAPLLARAIRKQLNEGGG